MTRARKTRDEFQVHGYYRVYGWEEVTSEDTRKEARERMREYRENEPGTAFKMVTRQVRLEVAV